MSMLQTFVSLFTQQNLSALREKFLHSTSWTQQGCKAYGAEQLKSIPLSWFYYAGLSRCDRANVVEGQEQSLVSLSLTPKDGTQNVDYVFWLEHQKDVIKSIHSIVDSKALISGLSLFEDDYLNRMPTPAPLVICNYDQQDHLQNELAKPSDYISNVGLSETLDLWWSIWAKSNLSAALEVYFEHKQPELIASYPATEVVLNLNQKLSRIFCQIESVIHDSKQGTVAIKWYLDGDHQGQRVRLNFISEFEFEQSKISVEKLHFDPLAFKKRYSNLSLFD